MRIEIITDGLGQRFGSVPYNTFCRLRGQNENTIYACCSVHCYQDGALRIIAMSQAGMWEVCSRAKRQDLFDEMLGYIVDEIVGQIKLTV